MEGGEKEGRGRRKGGREGRTKERKEGRERKERRKLMEGGR